jgi:hypothetical protein
MGIRGPAQGDLRITIPRFHSGQVYDSCPPLRLAGRISSRAFVFILRPCSEPALNEVEGTASVAVIIGVHSRSFVVRLAAKE